MRLLTLEFENWSSVQLMCCEQAFTTQQHRSCSAQLESQQYFLKSDAHLLKTKPRIKFANKKLCRRRQIVSAFVKSALIKTEFLMTGSSEWHSSFAFLTRNSASVTDSNTTRTGWTRPGLGSPRQRHLTIWGINPNSALQSFSTPCPAWKPTTDQKWPDS